MTLDAYVNHPALCPAQAERALIGSMLIAPGDYVPSVQAMLPPTAFYTEQLRIIYRALLALGEQADLLTVIDWLSHNASINHGVTEGTLAELATEVPTALNCLSYARIVAAAYMRRRMMDKLRDAAKTLFAGHDAGEVMTDITRTLVPELTRNDQDTPLQQIIAAYDAERAAEQMNPASTRGILTGIGDLDRLTNGWRNGKFYIVAGRPGDGKTTLMLNFVARACRAGKRVVVFSLEAGQMEIMRKLVADMAGINTSHQALRDMTPDKWAAETTAKNVIAGWKLELPCGLGYSVEDIAAKLRAYELRSGRVDLVVIDYLQLMRGPATDSRVAEVGAITRALKALAMTMGVPIIAGSQLSRAVSDGEPRLEHLRESGSIEQDADTVMMLHNPALAGQPSVRKLFIRKNRDGAVGDVTLIANFAFSRFGGAAIQI